MFSHIFSRKPRKTVDLKEAYDAAVDNARKAQITVANMDKDPCSIKAGSRRSVMLSLRLSAATASVIKGKLERGKKQLVMDEDQDLTKALLGRQATEFRVCERNFEADLARIGLTPHV
jgi:hypothetical protein